MSPENEKNPRIVSRVYKTEFLAGFDVGRNQLAMAINRVLCGSDCVNDGVSLDGCVKLRDACILSTMISNMASLKLSSQSYMAKMCLLACLLSHCVYVSSTIGYK